MGFPPVTNGVVFVPLDDEIAYTFTEVLSLDFVVTLNSHVKVCDFVKAFGVVTDGRGKVNVECNFGISTPVVRVTVVKIKRVFHPVGALATFDSPPVSGLTLAFALPVESGQAGTAMIHQQGALTVVISDRTAAFGRVVCVGHATGHS
jgi:hypothetical protein